jgi:hypothetical protein
MAGSASALHVPRHFMRCFSGAFWVSERLGCLADWFRQPGVYGGGIREEPHEGLRNARDEGGRGEAIRRNGVLQLACHDGYFFMGAVVSGTHHYFDNLTTVRQVVAALLALIVWPLLWYPQIHIS